MAVREIVDLPLERDLLGHIRHQDDHFQFGAAAQRLLHPVGRVLGAEELSLDIKPLPRRQDQRAMRGHEFADEVTRPDRERRSIVPRLRAGELHDAIAGGRRLRAGRHDLVERIKDQLALGRTRPLLDGGTIAGQFRIPQARKVPVGVGHHRPFDQGRDIVPGLVGALTVTAVVPAPLVEVEPADDRLPTIDDDELLMVGRRPQPRRRRRLPSGCAAAFPGEVPPQAGTRVEPAIVIVPAPEQLLDHAADAAPQEGPERLTPAPAEFAFMLDDDQLQPGRSLSSSDSSRPRMRR
jgi:hypothetical protein